MNAIEIDLQSCAARRHEHFQTAARVGGRRLLAKGGKFGIFLPDFEGPWGLKVMRNWPTEELPDGRIVLLDEGLMPDPGRASANIRRKAEELVACHRLLEDEGLGPRVRPEILEVRFSDRTVNELRHALQSDRYQGDDVFSAFLVETLPSRRLPLLRYLPEYKRFQVRLGGVAIRHNLRRRWSTQAALHEWRKPDCTVLTRSGFRIIDVDLANGMGPRRLSAASLTKFIQEGAQFPYGKRETQYQAYELDGAVIGGGRDSCRNRLAEMNLPAGFFEGKSILDLGCNIGGFCFLARELGAVYALGIDMNDESVEGAKYLRDYHGIQQTDFFTSDLEARNLAALIEAVSRRSRFDVVLAFSIVQHLKNQDAFLDFLSRLAAGHVVFEGHANETENTYLGKLRRRFSEVEFRGFSSDRNRRPLFLCRV
jgi:2-polyprenyl-3-methyl-5-hydroxy-6-metoxy-1,4-benzoquinol methylase